MKLSMHSDQAQAMLDDPQVYLGIPNHSEVGPDYTDSTLKGDELTTAVWTRAPGRVELRSVHATTHPDFHTVDTNTLSIYDSADENAEPTHRLANRREDQRLVTIDIGMVIGGRWLIWHQDFTKAPDSRHDFGYFADADRYNRLGDAPADDFLAHLETWHPIARQAKLILPQLGAIRSPSVVATPETTDPTAGPHRPFGLPRNRYVSPLS